jgi:small subunit ribosomal protein S4
VARYRGPACKLCRREGDKLYLKGERCDTAKCSFSKRSFAPGFHGKSPKKKSDYCVRLREKQKLARFYGVLERQFRSYFEDADKRPGVTGTLLLQTLEMRLDNFVFRLGLAASRKMARQMVKHGHFLINDKKVDIPSYQVKPTQVISIKKKSEKVFEVALEKLKEKDFPEWLEFDLGKKQGTIKSVPERKVIDVPVNEQLVVEYYSR